MRLAFFCSPPSLQTLKERLIKRNQDNELVIKKRLADAKETVSHVYDFEYLVINDDFVKALTHLQRIVEAGRLLQKRQAVEVQKLITELSQ